MATKKTDPVAYAHKILAVLDGLTDEAQVAAINIAEEILRYNRTLRTNPLSLNYFSPLSSLKSKWVRVKAKTRGK